MAIMRIGSIQLSIQKLCRIGRTRPTSTLETSTFTKLSRTWSWYTWSSRHTRHASLGYTAVRNTISIMSMPSRWTLLYCSFSFQLNRWVNFKSVISTRKTRSALRRSNISVRHSWLHCVGRKWNISGNISCRTFSCTSVDVKISRIELYFLSSHDS